MFIQVKMNMLARHFSMLWKNKRETSSIARRQKFISATSQSNHNMVDSHVSRIMLFMCTGVQGSIVVDFIDYVSVLVHLSRHTGARCSYQPIKMLV